VNYRHLVDVAIPKLAIDVGQDRFFLGCTKRITEDESIEEFGELGMQESIEKKFINK